MPYESVAEIPDYVPKKKRRQWLRVFNSAYSAAVKDGKGAKEAEEIAFAEANGVAGPNAKKGARSAVKAIGTDKTGFVRANEGPFRCGHCEYFERKRGLDGGDGLCSQKEVNADPGTEKEPHDGKKLIVAAGDCCNEYEPVEKEKAAMSGKLQASGHKGHTFIKVDDAKREVWGIVTAEEPDKDQEVCDYATSLPFYKAVVDEMSKATEGENLFPLREMHQLNAIGKCIGVEFRDADREIFMGFKVVDDDAWKKVQERVLTGFSHGGVVIKSWDDPVYDGCRRYTADPSEISLVDNPCLGAAHIQHIKSDGSVELWKVNLGGEKQMATATTTKAEERAKELESEIKELLKEAKTKRVAGEDLPASSFLIVGDKEDTSTWKLPVKFASEPKTKRHLRNALARFNQLKGVSEEDKKSAWKKLVALCEKYDIDVAAEKARLDRIQGWIQKQTRRTVNKIARRLPGGNPGYALATLDFELGKLHKGMCEVSGLARLVEELGWLCYGVCAEQQWEGDNESPLPDMLSDNIEALLDTLLSMVEEESQEMREDLANRVSA